MLTLALTKTHETFPAGHPALLVADATYPRISQGGLIFRNQDSLRFSHHLQGFRINLRNKKRGAMPKHVVVVCALASVDQEEATATGHPMLLRVITAEWQAIVKSPLTDRIELQSIS